MEAILSATALGGEIMLHPHELGKVQPGYYADLIIVDGDPLKDITVLSGHKHIDLVMIVCQKILSLTQATNGRTDESIKSACLNKVHTTHPIVRWLRKLKSYN
jgi:cytosine/adenosine deaminase-related metal-dependent hydrolase